jgi:SAM-dependent methyltransferase
MRSRSFTGFMIAQQSKQKYNFILERLSNPVAQRITKGLKNALESLEHNIIEFEPNQSVDRSDLFQAIRQIQNSQIIDYWIIINNSSLLLSQSQELGKINCELIEIPLIFIHYENIASSIATHKEGNLLQAFQRVNERSFHFCLEYSNLLDLREIGCDRVYPISHASEFEQARVPKDYRYTVSIVEDLSSDVENNHLSAFKNYSYFHHLQADFWNRLVKFDNKIEPSATWVANQISSKDNSNNFWEHKFFYIHLISLMSPLFRSEIINKLTDIDIISKAPRLKSKQELNNRGGRYHFSLTDYNPIQAIYATSKINLNITSLQFDNAVVDKVIDVAAVGGFILTDWKSELRRITSVHEEISYRTIDELHAKIEYYLSHEEERLELADCLHQDVIKNCTYLHLVNCILSQLCVMSNTASEKVRVDLGCGFRKPEGFIGVDIYPRPEVDIIADLTQRFPFPDSSVDEIRAHDAIEHLPDRIHTMNEIWRICKPGATVDIVVPSTDGRGAFQDPTHVSFWNVNSFMYYCIEFPDYLELCRSYGFKGAFSILNLHQEKYFDGNIAVKALLSIVKPIDAWLPHEINQALAKEIKLLILPNWIQPEESLVANLANVLITLGKHPDKSKIVLLIDTSNCSDTNEESPDLILSGILLNILLSEELDIANNGPEIHLLGELREGQWEAVSRQIHYRVIIPNENTTAIAERRLENIPVCELNNLSHQRFFQL